MKTGAAPMRARHVTAAHLIRVQMDVEPPRLCPYCQKRIDLTERADKRFCIPAHAFAFKAGRTRTLPHRGMTLDESAHKRMSQGKCRLCSNQRENLDKQHCAACRERQRIRYQKAREAKQEPAAK